eukprot:m.138683 g.138683  ORF g.138683 m.138683 type:complete len:461 (+) comp24042_c0_seq1:349-1731(+)
MRNLSDYLHAKGLKFGLYTARYNRTCGGNMPGSLGHEKLDSETFAAMGADFLKNDDCHVNYSHAFQDYGAMEQAIAALPVPMLHNVKAPDLNASVAADVCQFRRVAKDLKNTWQDMVRVLDTGTDEGFQAAAGPAKSFFNDFDMLEVGNSEGRPYAPSMTVTEWEAHFSLWAVMKSPLVLGNDPRHMSSEVLSILSNKEVIAVNQDPLGIQAKRISSSPAPGSNDAGSTAKLYLANCSASLALQQQFVIDKDQIQLKADGRCVEVWACQTLWPWWISVSPCKSRLRVRTNKNNTKSYHQSTCKGNQKWTVHSDGSIESTLTGCWPHSGGQSSSEACCLSAEGSNPEIDKCGWMVNAKRQHWTMTSKGQLKNSLNNMCLTLGGNLQVFGGPLSGGRFTAVLFNRSENKETITVEFEDLGLSSATKLEIRDILKHVDLGSFVGSFSAVVAAHAVVHVILTPS